MSDKKKDLTRIEDLGEYLHELNEEEESEQPFSPLSDSEEETPTETFDFPSEDLSFGATEEAAPEEETKPFEEGSLDFGTSDFEASDPFAETAEETTPETSEVSEPEPFQEEEPEPLPQYSPEPEPEPIPEPRMAPETFEEVKKFAESSNFTGMGAEGNPSFSVLIKSVRYIEDVNDIVLMLKEIGLLTDSEEVTKGRLMRGSLLVPRISEFAAIFLAHKLRRFDIDIQVGLSDEIHPPKHHEMSDRGVVSKHSLQQNQSHHFHFDETKVDISQVIVSATSNLEGHQVVRYLGVATEHKLLDGHVVEDETSDEVPVHYSELAQKLKAHALKAKANAVIGLNYQLTPVSSSKYRLTCTGNLVWVNKL